MSARADRARSLLAAFFENDFPRIATAQLIGILLVRKTTLDDSNGLAMVGAALAVWLCGRRRWEALALSVAIELVLCAAGKGPDVPIGAVVVCAAEIFRTSHEQTISRDRAAVAGLSVLAAVGFVPYLLRWDSAAVFPGPAPAPTPGSPCSFSALHDVVAHQMSVVVAQSQGAAAIVESNPARARTALDLIARTTRDALVELRRLLGVVRSMEEGDTTPVEPQPRLLDIETLATTGRAAGLDVTVVFTGRPDGVADAVALSAYRVVQEALTNAAKHAPAATVAVRVSGGVHELTVGVVNGPAKRKVPALAGSQSGLVGMRERVEVFGGTLATGPTDEGGWSVVARFPTLVSPADE